LHDNVVVTFIVRDSSLGLHIPSNRFSCGKLGLEDMQQRSLVIRKPFQVKCLLHLSSTAHTASYQHRPQCDGAEVERLRKADIVAPTKVNESTPEMGRTAWRHVAMSPMCLLAIPLAVLRQLTWIWQHHDRTRLFRMHCHCRNRFTHVQIYYP